MKARRHIGTKARSGDPILRASLRRASSPSHHSDFGFRISDFRPRGGFTLVELMISIALVLVLMVGVNYVFTKAADAISAGQTTNTISRDSQSAQAVLFDDFNHVNKNPPCFI